MLRLGSIAHDFQLASAIAANRAQGGMDLSYEFCICNDDLLRAYIATQIVFF